jgi:hypothetical protein
MEGIAGGRASEKLRERCGRSSQPECFGRQHPIRQQRDPDTLAVARGTSLSLFNAHFHQDDDIFSINSHQFHRTLPTTHPYPVDRTSLVLLWTTIVLPRGWQHVSFRQPADAANRVQPRGPTAVEDEASQ